MEQRPQSFKMQVSVEGRQPVFRATNWKPREWVTLQGPGAGGCRAIFNRCATSVWDDKILEMDSVDVAQLAGQLT